MLVVAILMLLILPMLESKHVDALTESDRENVLEMLRSCGMGELMEMRNALADTKQELQELRQLNEAALR